ncbi:hypothetical protein DCC81_09025 [Chitinophaga parva]|uniref:Uncharacterized protein n=1 Tax=Chitinophaga parva TaxID=2169414 RepID=A0A2T7BPK0_9BACT|nr:hypothetical protein DCC81_09025 [Chitinophaga parva]
MLGCEHFLPAGSLCFTQFLNGRFFVGWKVSFQAILGWKHFFVCWKRLFLSAFWNARIFLLAESVCQCGSYKILKIKFGGKG